VEGVDSKNSLGSFLNHWEIPAEAVIYWRAKPAFSPSTSEYARNTSTKCISLSKGAGATSIDGSGTLWFFELARVLVRFDHIACVIENANLQRPCRRIQNSDMTRTIWQDY